MLSSFSRKFLCPPALRCVRRLSYPQEPLNQPLAGLAETSEENPSRKAEKDFLSDCQITKLENGLRVASQEAFGQYSTVGGDLGVGWGWG